MPSNLSLLPATATSFSREKYWDTFFTNRTEGFDWYGTYEQLSSLLQKYILQKDSILVVGCGNSELSHEMYAAGYKNQLNLDISEVVISQMKKSYPYLTYEVGDVTSIQCPDENFTCVLDKGTFDALTPIPPREVFIEELRNSDKGNIQQLDLKSSREESKAVKMLDEVARVLKVAGRFICISLLQEHVAKLLVGYFNDLGWMIRVSRCQEAEKQPETPTAIVFPVYVCVFTKMRKTGTPIRIIEFFGSENKEKPVRLGSVPELLDLMKQDMVMSWHRRAIKTIGYAADAGLELKLCDEAGSTKYIMNLVDVSSMYKNPITKRFAVFIVPQGRESEYFFATHEGRTSLALQAGFTRLVVYHLLRDRIYPSMDEVKQEISENLGFVTPEEIIVKGIQTPILTIGDDSSGLGKREIIHKGKSEFSGDYVVEDVQYAEKGIVRRLIFLNAPSVIQSEVIIKTEKQGKGKNKELKKIPVSTVLTCDHHGIMALAVGMLKYFMKEDEAKLLDVLVIGLGGGLLVSFLHAFFPQVKITAVELDKEIVDVGRKYFGLPDIEDERLHVVVQDGLEFVKDAETKYSVIMVDVDNKSVKEGLSCPPPEFLTPDTIEDMKRSLTPNGIFALNFVCRNRALEKKYKDFLCSHFPFIYQYDLSSDVNTVFICFMITPPGKSNLFSQSLAQTVRYVRDAQYLQNQGGAGGPAPWTTEGKKKGKAMPAVALDDSEDNIATLTDDESLDNMCRKFIILR